jgi:hypothetical protein
MLLEIFRSTNSPPRAPPRPPRDSKAIVYISSFLYVMCCVLE